MVGLLEAIGIPTLVAAGLFLWVYMALSTHLRRVNPNISEVEVLRRMHINTRFITYFIIMAAVVGLGFTQVLKLSPEQIGLVGGQSFPVTVFVMGAFFVLVAYSLALVSAYELIESSRARRLRHIRGDSAESRFNAFEEEYRREFRPTQEGQDLKAERRFEGESGSGFKTE